jgi:hypothetical protein
LSRALSPLENGRRVEARQVEAFLAAEQRAAELVIRQVRSVLRQAASAS